MQGFEFDRQLRRAERVETWLAHRPPAGEPEVVKVVRLDAVPAAFLAAFLAEYGKLRDVLHRHVAACREVGSTDDAGFVALEYIDGPTLGEAVRGGLPVGRALNALAQACMAVHSLHQVGIVHGGIGLESWRLRADESLVLVDFDVTRRVEQQLSSPPGAPPQARADFAALGGLLHAMLTGERGLAERTACGASGESLREASRLPIPLMPIQPVLDGLVGIGPGRPITDADELLRGLFALRESFPITPSLPLSRAQAASAVSGSAA